MRIFYVTTGQHVAGGQLINLEHVAALRRMGFDARFLILPMDDAGDAAPTFPPGLESPWQYEAELTADDWVVCGEMHGRGMLHVIKSPARKVVHNQNWHYSFQAVRDMPSLRRWGCEAIIAGSRIGAEKIVELGWDGPIPAVRVFVEPAFAQPLDAPRKLAVAFMSRKRGMEGKLINGALLSLHPRHLDVPWVQIRGVARPKAAEMVKGCEVFLSLSHMEGLGLPPLEAMAAGSLVVGFHGVGGLEYATEANGDWFDDAASPRRHRPSPGRAAGCAQGRRAPRRPPPGRPGDGGRVLPRPLRGRTEGGLGPDPRAAARKLSRSPHAKFRRRPVGVSLRRV
ncbi:glycosyltransferase [Phenylobacterium sp. J367]|uniref:glycosyltransferase n=1 Tax=Phenylobacterium sp. J367 TaxID=2898435 RepID=UPI0021518624|nr:glycosyltransferase [Phenylobacterium sp. J367]MCR5880516.1 glycosyltransferase [Phenylobacterium sp. J367]